LVEQFNIEKAMVFSAMDEPLFKYFGSEKMIVLIKLLGMKEDEAIEHSAVTKYITRGQEKIAAIVTAEQFAQSQEEWMRKNVQATTPE
jgi:preprotein translocase subunit SecA